MKKILIILTLLILAYPIYAPQFSFEIPFFSLEKLYSSMGFYWGQYGVLP